VISSPQKHQHLYKPARRLTKAITQLANEREQFEKKRIINNCLEVIFEKNHQGFPNKVHLLRNKFARI
jgi:hypothetical protein